MQNEDLNILITPFVLRVVLEHVGLSWIIDKNKHLNFDIGIQLRQWTYKSPRYNTTIFLQLNGQSFKDFLKTECKYRNKFMFDIDSYNKENGPMPDNANIGGGIIL